MRGGIPICSMVASLCFYAAGLLWNDVFDASIDAKERPSRPIPSGRVSRMLVFLVGVGLAGLGLLLAWNGFSVALVLLGLILFYNVLAKHIAWIGVITMGCCRGMNIYLGAATSWPMGETPVVALLLWVMLFFTGYIVLVSVIAKNEAVPGAKTGKVRFLAPLMCLLLVPLFLWFDRGVWWPPIVVAMGLAAYLLRSLRVPELVAGLIRFLIPLQCVCCLAMYESGCKWVVLFFCSCFIGALLAARRFSGS